MKRKQLCSIITAALMATTLVMPCNVKQANAKEETSVSASSIDRSKVNVEYTRENSGQKQIRGTIKITNNTGADLDLSQVPLNYDYTNESGEVQQFHCDYAGGSVKGQWQTITDNVKGTFNNINDPKKGDTQLNLSINSVVLGDGDSVSIQIRINCENWADYDETNDYGLDWGEPSPIVTPGNIEITEGHASDKNVNIDANGSEATLVGIYNGNNKLTEGQDYTVDANGNVVLKESYLNNLTSDATLTYKFSDNSTQTQTIKVIPVPHPTVTTDGKAYDPSNPSDINSKIDFKGINDVELEKITNGDDQLTLGTDYTVNNKTNVVINKDYLKKFVTDSDNTITLTYWFSDGTKCDVKILIKGDVTQILNIKADKKVPAEAGQQVKVPVRLSNVKKSLSDFSFKVSYDDKELELTGVEAAGVTDGYDTSFMISDKEAGSAVINYTMSSDDQTITQDGDLCYLVFNVKADAEGGETPVKITEPLFGHDNAELGEIEPVNTYAEDGSVKVKVDMPTLTVADKVEAAQGSQVKVPVKLSDVKNSLADFSFKVSFDANKLELTGVEGAGVTDGYDSSFMITDKQAGSAVVNYTMSSDDQTITESGDLCYLVFNVKKDAKVGETAVEITEPLFGHDDPDLGEIQPVKVAVENGSVLIVPNENVLTIAADKDVEGKKGQVVKVPVKLSKVQQSLADFSFKVSYEANKLELTGVEGAGVTEGYDSSFMITDKQAGSAVVNYTMSSDDQTITESGDLCYLVFNVKADAELGETPVEITEPLFGHDDPDLGEIQPVEAFAKAGSVKIVDGEAEEFNPTAKLDSANTEFNQENPKDIVFDINADGGEFKGLKESANYTKDSDSAKVTVSKDYFENLNEDAVLTFEFTKNGKTKIVKVKVPVKVKAVEEDPEVKLENSTFDQEKPADVVADVTLNGNKFSGVKGIDSSKVTVDGDKVIIDKSVFANESGDSKDLTFEFTQNGKVKDVTVTLNIHHKNVVVNDLLTFKTENVTAAAGSTVNIPIMIHIDKSKTIKTIGFDYADAKGTTYKSFKGGEEFSKYPTENGDFAFPYVKKLKTASAYVIFPETVKPAGDYLFGTLTLTLDSNLASGTVINLDIQNVQFMDEEYNEDKDQKVNLGTITVK